MKAGYGTTAFQWADQQVANCACDYLEEKANGKDERPFAAVSSIWLPHCPFIAPKDLFEKGVTHGLKIEEVFDNTEIEDLRRTR